jgi:hypothetical protein
MEKNKSSKGKAAEKEKAALESPKLTFGPKSPSDGEKPAHKKQRRSENSHGIIPLPQCMQRSNTKRVASEIDLQLASS